MSLFCKPLPAEREYYVIAANGQSNMDGGSTSGPEFERSSYDSNIQLWAGGAFQAARPQDMGTGYNNPAYSAAEKIISQTSKPVYIIYEAWNGQRSDWWHDNTNPTAIQTGFDAKINAALAALGAASIDGYLWLQGESNFNFTGSYLKFLNAYIPYLRSQPYWDVSATKFVAGGLAQQYDKINLDILSLNSDASPLTSAIDAISLSYGPDGLHLDNNGIMDMGQLMGCELL